MNTHQQLLLTRPIEASEQDKRWFSERGISSIISPMLTYQYNKFIIEPVQNYEGIIITSAQSVRALSTRTIERNVPLFCVGNQSADTAKAQGFKNVISARGTALELIELIKSRKRTAKPYLYARGADISTDIEAALKECAIPCESVIAYKATLTQAFSAPCVQALMKGTIYAAAFTSVRGAKNFARLVCVNNLSNQLKTIKALCLSNNVLEYIQTLEWADTSVCPMPDGEAFKEFILQSYFR